MSVKDVVFPPRFVFLSPTGDYKAIQDGRFLQFVDAKRHNPARHFVGMPVICGDVAGHITEDEDFVFFDRDTQPGPEASIMVYAAEWLRSSDPAHEESTEDHARRGAITAKIEAEKNSMVIIDMSLKNSWLYDGCKIETAGGRLNLVTPPADAMTYIGRNLDGYINQLSSYHRQQVTLTGGMAIWAYLAAFHVVVHAFKKVYYDDGKGGSVLVAAHG